MFARTMVDDFGLIEDARQKREWQRGWLNRNRFEFDFPLKGSAL